MATGTFAYYALRTKTLKGRIKTQRKVVSHSNSTRAMLLVNVVGEQWKFPATISLYGACSEDILVQTSLGY